MARVIGELVGIVNLAGVEWALWRHRRGRTEVAELTADQARRLRQRAALSQSRRPGQGVSVELAVDTWTIPPAIPPVSPEETACSAN